MTLTKLWTWWGIGFVAAAVFSTSADDTGGAIEGLSHLAMNLVVLAGILLTFWSIWGAPQLRRLQEERRARAARDEMSLIAAVNPIPFGTPISSVPNDHPWAMTVEARRRVHGGRSLTAPANPFWSDEPVMDATWWVLGAGPEETFAEASQATSSASARRYEAWKRDLREHDLARFSAVLQWEQQQELVVWQRRAASAAEAQAAETSRLADEERLRARGEEAAARKRDADLSSIRYFTERDFFGNRHHERR